MWDSCKTSISPTRILQTFGYKTYAKNLKPQDCTGPSGGSCTVSEMATRKSLLDLIIVSLSIVAICIFLNPSKVYAWKPAPVTSQRVALGNPLQRFSQGRASSSSLTNDNQQGSDLMREQTQRVFHHLKDTTDEHQNVAYKLQPPNVADDELASSSSSDVDDSEEAASLDHEDSMENAQETPERNMFLEQHRSQLQAMHDLFERRQLNTANQLQASQELNPISIGLDPTQGAPGPPFLPPFSVSNRDPQNMNPLAKQMSGPDNLDQGLGPSLPFGLGPLPHLLGFQNQPFDGPQRGDQSSHSNHHADMPPTSESDPGPGQKIWPKIFRFTDGRINLADFEKQKKIRLSNKNQHGGENHIESTPVIFDGRQLKRKSFLILHGGIFSR